jgi:hypothetical protein
MEATSSTTCACKRGFFTLRDCENPASVQCGICSRRVCEEHLAPRVDSKVCVECAATQKEQGAVRVQADPTDRGLPYRYRSRYYQDYDYQPMWWGSYDPYWSGYGYRWYDDPYDDDDDGGGFDDS